jgi:hypothetical protein
MTRQRWPLREVGALLEAHAYHPGRSAEFFALTSGSAEYRGVAPAQPRRQ